VRPPQHRSEIIATGYSVTWTGDLADDLADLPTKRRFILPEIAVADVRTVADQKVLDAERAAAKHVAHARPPITRKLLADVLAGLRRL
jgi:hypothetical protein